MRGGVGEVVALVSDCWDTVFMFSSRGRHTMYWRDWSSDVCSSDLKTSSFREVALWTIDDNTVTDSTINLKATPWADRIADNDDPSLLFSSYTHGDPNTPLPRAYVGEIGRASCRERG